MGLRPVNCLFIDDNQVNLNEAKFYAPELLVADPKDAIPYLLQYVEKNPATDLEHNRLKQYEVLQEKQKAKNAASDNLSFLYDSKTVVEIHKDCTAQIDRIVELINRTNQLNFTKLRSSKEEIVELLKDGTVDAGYVTVSDKYGDYGIVGFYAVKDGICIHFLFSCRTIGQGVEQWVYATLGYPSLTIVGEVVNKVSHDEAPKWINQNQTESINAVAKSSAKVVMKGACDLCIMASYLNSSNIIEEFTYIGTDRHNRIEHHNHSINYLNLPFLSEDDRKILISDCIFNDSAMFQTALYDEDTKLIFVSSQIEPHLGIYRNKSNGIKIAFSAWDIPLTDSANWAKYIEGKFYQNDFTLEFLESFASKYEFVGRLEPDDFIGQLKILFEKISKDAHVCVLCGVEIPYLSNGNHSFDDRHIYYAKINRLLEEYSKTEHRLHLIHFGDYVKEQSDFTDNINHYQRRIYYEAAREANEIINSVTGISTQRTSMIAYHLENVKRRIWQYASSLYHKIFR